MEAFCSSSCRNEATETDKRCHSCPLQTPIMIAHEMKAAVFVVAGPLSGLAIVFSSTHVYKRYNLLGLRLSKTKETSNWSGPIGSEVTLDPMGLQYDPGLRKYDEECSLSWQDYRQSYTIPTFIGHFASHCSSTTLGVSLDREISSLAKIICKDFSSHS